MDAKITVAIAGILFGAAFCSWLFWQYSTRDGAPKRFRLRTLVILTAVGPPLLWGTYVLLKPPGRLFWAGCFIASLLICAPFAALRLNIFRIKL